MNPKFAQKGKKKESTSAKGPTAVSPPSTKRKRSAYGKSIEPESGREYRICQCGLHILKILGKTTSPWITFSNHAGKDYKKCKSRGYKNNLQAREKVNSHHTFYEIIFEAAQNELVFMDFPTMKAYCVANPAARKVTSVKRGKSKRKVAVESPVKVS